MFAHHAGLLIPELVLSLVADAFIESGVECPAIGAVLADTCLLELAFRAERAAAVGQDVLPSSVQASTGVVGLVVNFVLTAVHLHAGSH